MLNVALWFLFHWNDLSYQISEIWSQSVVFNANCTARTLLSVSINACSVPHGVQTNRRGVKSFRSSIGNNFLQNRGVNSKSLSARRGFPWSDLCYLSSKFPLRNLAYRLTFDCPSIYDNYPRAGRWSFIIAYVEYVRYSLDIGVKPVCITSMCERAQEQIYITRNLIDTIYFFIQNARIHFILNV